LSANALVHVQGVGDFEVEEIVAAVEPGRASATRDNMHSTMMCTDMPEEGRRLAVRDESVAEQLLVENTPDPLLAEQTWPEEDELMQAELALQKRATRKRLVPKGTSAYQASWMLEESEEEYDEDADDDDSPEHNDDDDDEGLDEDEEMQGLQGMEDADEDEEDKEELVELDEEDEDGKKQLNREALEHRRQEAAAERERLWKLAEAGEADFPDEVDTPMDSPARQRFQKYRGLKSFRTSPWDPKESLPLDYGRIFAFQNFKRAQVRVMRRLDAQAALPSMSHVIEGSYVTVRIKGISRGQARLFCARCGLPEGEEGLCTNVAVVVGLLQHESKVSVLNFSLKKHAGYASSLKSKQPLLLRAGFRQWVSRGVLSEDSSGTHKFKYLRFLHSGVNAVLSIYAPVTFAPAPLLAFAAPLASGYDVPSLQDVGLQYAHHQSILGDALGAASNKAGHDSVMMTPRPQDEAVRHLQLAAVGGLIDVNPDRVVLKRVVLSGYPYKVHKRRATVRWMFFNPEDVRWFKPVELWTKYGRRGRITEPIGTHGLMKCLFDGVLQQRDAVCMSLYKRVFPKWPASSVYA